MSSPTLFERKASSRKSEPKLRRLGLENLEDRRVLSADPGWLAGIGGAGTDSTYHVTPDDATGDVYVAGSFAGTVDFDPGPDITTLTATGATDGYVARYDSGGTLLWARRMGGVADTGQDIAGRVLLGPDGFIYATGRYATGGDFDGDGLADQPNRGGNDLFVTKLDSATGSAVWTRTFGGDLNDFGGDFGIATDGSLFITGGVSSSTATVDIDPGPGVTPIAAGSFGAVFVLKLDAAGNYVTSWGGITTDGQARPRIAVDDSGVYLGGVYRGTVDFDSGPGQAIRQPYQNGTQHDAFVARYSQQGEFGWVRTLRGTNTSNWEDWVNGLAIDADRVYVGGNYYWGLDLNDDNVADVPGNGTRATFLAGYTKSNGSLNWAKNIGTIGTSAGEAVAQVLATDGTGGLLAFGYFTGTVDFDPGPGVNNLTAAATSSYSLKLDGATGAFQNASRLEGYHVNTAKVDGNGMLYLGGQFAGTAAFSNGQFHTSAGGPDFGLGNDGFVLKSNLSAPRVSVTAPTAGQQLTEGGTVSFAATAIDDQDGTLSTGIQWQSQLAGNLGTGASIGPVALGVGTHVVIARATDSDGLVGGGGVSVLVNPKAPTNLTGTVSGSQVTLRWTDNSGGETGYQVERAVKPSGKNATPVWSVIATLPAIANTHVDAPGSGSWLYQVKATATGVSSAYSNRASVSVGKGGPKSASTTLTATAEPLSATSSDTSTSAGPSGTSSAVPRPAAPAQLLIPVTAKSRSKLADAALAAADENWLDGALDDDMLPDLVTAS